MRSSLVLDTQLTGDAHLCVLIDGTVQKFPIATVGVDTPYYKGELEAMCKKVPIYAGWKTRPRCKLKRGSGSHN